MRKYLFLDIDGVIALPSVSDLGADDEWGLSECCLDALELIVDIVPDLWIVISSSWRRGDRDATLQKMRLAGFPPKVLDRIVGETMRPYRFFPKGLALSIPRGVLIKQWIDHYVHSGGSGIYIMGQNGVHAPKGLGTDYEYAILDDRDDMLLEQDSRYFKVTGSQGLTFELAQQLISHFEGCGRFHITKQFTRP